MARELSHGDQQMMIRSCSRVSEGKGVTLDFLDLSEVTVLLRHDEKGVKGVGGRCFQADHLLWRISMGAGRL